MMRPAAPAPRSDDADPLMPLADTATWIAVGFAIGAAVLALGASLVLLALVVRRGKGRAPGRAPRAGLRAVPDEVADAIVDARAETRRSRQLAEIAATIDLDAVLERTLAAATDTAGVDAAMAVVRREEEDEPLVATFGMTAVEAARQPVTSLPSGGARAVRISYRYDPEDGSHEEGNGALISGGVSVPLREDNVGTIGTLAVFWRGTDRVPEDGVIGVLEELSRTSAPAISNAQQFRVARHLADVDGLTGLHNRRYFHETLARETARAERYDRSLALVVLDDDDFTEPNDRLGNLGGDAVLAAVADRLLGAVRRADVACRVGGDEFAVILPEAGARDAEQLNRRIQFAIGSGSAGPAEHVRMSAGIAALRPEDDAISLFQRADEALYRAKEDGKGQVRMADGSSA
jgi:diguanylate cyclase (GGDEF)-like protein